MHIFVCSLELMLFNDITDVRWWKTYKSTLEVVLGVEPKAKILWSDLCRIYSKPNVTVVLNSNVDVKKCSFHANICVYFAAFNFGTATSSAAPAFGFSNSAAGTSKPFGTLLVLRYACSQQMLFMLYLLD